MSIAAVPPPQSPLPSNAVWTRRFLVAGTIFAALGIVAAGLWLLHLLVLPLVLLILSGVLAFVLYPAVQALKRFMPASLAVVVTFVLVLAAVIVLGLILANTLIGQIRLLSKTVEALLQPGQLAQHPAVVSLLGTLGISPGTVHLSGQDLAQFAQGVLGGLVGVVGHLFSLFIYASAVATITAYLLLDGPWVFRWLRTKTPVKYRARVGAALDVMNQTMGGFFRGQLLLAALMSVVCGVGAYFIGVPFAFLLAIIVFVFEFIPTVGAYISGTIGVVLALTHGWQPAVLYLIYSSVMQGIVDGQFLTPRILGKSVHINPIISILVLFAGFELFGVIGAFLAVPVAGVVQAFIDAYWSAWRAEHPDQFPEDASAGDTANVTSRRPPPTGADEGANATGDMGVRVDAELGPAAPA